MKEFTITKKNAMYQKFEVLKTNRTKRHRFGEFLVEGVRNINGAIEYGWDIVAFLYSDPASLSDWAKNILKTVRTEYNCRLSPELMAELSGKDDTSELLAIVKMNDLTPDEAVKKLSDNPAILLFDRPSNCGNLGTIIRTCDSFGIELLITTGHAVDPYEPATVTSTMGSFFCIPHLHIAENDALLEFIGKLRETYGKLSVYGSTAHKQHPIWEADCKAPTLMMVGNETYGLSAAFKEICDMLVTIPMAETSSASSFNVACAASIMCYEIVRQRSFHSLD